MLVILSTGPAVTALGAFASFRVYWGSGIL